MQRSNIPDNPTEYNKYLELHIPKDNGCPLVRFLLKGIVPADQVTCEKHCPFTKCIISDSCDRQATTKKAETLRAGFLAGLNYSKVLVESK